VLDIPELLSGSGDLGTHIPITIDVTPLGARVDHGLIQLGYDALMLAVPYLLIIKKKGGYI
jgi:hypothetical protein